MTLKEAIEQRHSVRRYTDRKIDEATAAGLQKTIDECNRLSGLNIQLVLDEPVVIPTTDGIAITETIPKSAITPNNSINVNPLLFIFHLNYLSK